MFGRQPKIPLDLICETEEIPESDVDIVVEGLNQDQLMVNVYVEELKTRLQEVYQHAENCRDLKVEKSKIYHDRNIRPVSYEPEDLVLLNKPQVKKGQSKKLAPKWEGPFKIVEKVGQVNYRIKRLNQPKSKIKLVHHNRLKRFFGNYSNVLDDSVIEEPTQNPKTTKKRVRSNRAKVVRSRVKKHLNNQLGETIQTPTSEPENSARSTQLEENSNTVDESSESAPESAEVVEQFEPLHEETN
jgi:hypothetical protein